MVYNVIRKNFAERVWSLFREFQECTAGAEQKWRLLKTSYNSSSFKEFFQSTGMAALQFGKWTETTWTKSNLCICDTLRRESGRPSCEKVQNVILGHFGHKIWYWQANKMFWQTIQHLRCKRCNTARSIKTKRVFVSNEGSKLTDGDSISKILWTNHFHTIRHTGWGNCKRYEWSLHSDQKHWRLGRQQIAM